MAHTEGNADNPIRDVICTLVGRQVGEQRRDQCFDRNKLMCVRRVGRLVLDVHKSKGRRKKKRGRESYQVRVLTTTRTKSCCRGVTLSDTRTWEIIHDAICSYRFVVLLVRSWFAFFFPWLPQFLYECHDQNLHTRYLLTRARPSSTKSQSTCNLHQPTDNMEKLVPRHRPVICHNCV